MFRLLVVVTFGNHVIICEGAVNSRFRGWMCARSRVTRPQSSLSISLTSIHGKPIKQTHPSNRCTIDCWTKQSNGRYHAQLRRFQESRAACAAAIARASELDRVKDSRQAMRPCARTYTIPVVSIETLLAVYGLTDGHQKHEPN